MSALELQLTKAERGPGSYLGPHLRAVIGNSGQDPVAIRRVHLVGYKSQTKVARVMEAPSSVRAGQSAGCAITLTSSAARRLRRDGGVVLEAECEDGQCVRSCALEARDVETWTPGQEIKAAVGVLLGGAVWWYVVWGSVLKFAPALQIIVLVFGAALAVSLCSVFYLRLWRGEETSGTGLSVSLQRRVRPLTDVVLTAVGVWVILTAPFAFATFLIDGQHLGVGGAGTLFTHEHERYAEAIGLYVWHAIDVLPFIQATTTLHWTEPVRDYSHATGALLLLYKALVLAPVVAAAVAAWRGRARREPRPQDDAARSG